MCVLLGVFREFPVDPYYEPLAWFMINVCVSINYNITTSTLAWFMINVCVSINYNITTSMAGL